MHRRGYQTLALASSYRILWSSLDCTRRRLIGSTGVRAPLAKPMLRPAQLAAGFKAAGSPWTVLAVGWSTYRPYDAAQPKRSLCGPRLASDGVIVEVRRAGTGRSGAVATRLPVLAKLALQGRRDRLQYGKMAVIVEMGRVDLNVQPPCPVL